MSLRWLWIILSIIVGSLIVLGGGKMDTSRSSAAALDLHQYQWKNRLLLIFAPTETDATYQQQRQLLDASAAEVKERDLIVLPVVEAAANQDLRTQFNIANGAFAVILIGKDGGEKARFERVISAAQLFAIIDAMPMRQSEMKGN